jgi:hypothetical protein
MRKVWLVPHYKCAATERLCSWLRKLQQGLQSVRDAIRRRGRSSKPVRPQRDVAE